MHGAEVNHPGSQSMLEGTSIAKTGPPSLPTPTQNLRNHDPSICHPQQRRFSNLTRSFPGPRKATTVTQPQIKYGLPSQLLI